MKRRRLLLWLGLSVVCFVAVLLLWPRAATTPGRHEAGNIPAATAGARSTSPAGIATVRSASTAPFAMLSSPGLTNAAAAAVAARDARLKYRVSNTALTVGQLARSERGILLANALIDSSRPVNLAIPDSLRSQGDPGSYIVQASGPIDRAFRARLKGAGANIVAYIPNNAFLVRASANAAQLLASVPGTQTVLPFEPYYKLDSSLLELTMEEKPLPPDSTLNLVVFADARDTVVSALTRSGSAILAEQPSPFGPVLRVRPAAESVTTMAGWSGVQTIGLASRRIPANDLSRSTVGVAADSITMNNYLGLSGLNVMVAVNDSGVDAQHPDLAGRVFGPSLTDLNGHGTHVAGIIASSGGQSATVTNAPGSFLPANTNQFRGMAPMANIFAQSLNVSDFELQERAARTNASIANSSWNYGSADYDIFAASYDAAVRDSLPEITGSQSVQYVFSAGNSGFGNNDGLGGAAGLILSPATAKNVITVGAIELARNISNLVTVVKNGGTNSFPRWLGQTDSGVQVANFSSRGNVGIGVEGEFGRVKPDVVAPGTFVISTTWQDPGHWDMASYYNPTNYRTKFFEDQVVDPDTLHTYFEPVPDNLVRLDISVSSTTNSSLHFPIYVSALDFPTTADFVGYDNVSLAPPAIPTLATIFYAIGNTSSVPLSYNLTTTVVTTNDDGDLFLVLSNLNRGCGPYYRFETGTSMAAADVSGMLALIADFYTNTLHQLPPSPALMKALVINGARSVNDLLYDLQVANVIDYQGWGLVALTNSLPPALTNGLANQAAGAPMLIFDQSPTNALATGDRQTFIVKADATVADQPLRVTLVWTDPPGNPVAGIKLVNDLDLVVTNLDSQDVYYGNDIPALSDFNTPSITNVAPNVDIINNVENAYILSSLSTNGFSITVIGHRVNVNAVTAHTNEVAQDYALVISCGNGLHPTGLKIQSTTPIIQDNTPNVTAVTNQFAGLDTAPGEGVAGALLLNQHVGASTPLYGTNELALGTNTIWGVDGSNGVIVLGVTNQWHFYAITNTTTFTNAAFATFLAPTLALPRMGVTNVNNPPNATRVEADIDLYVARGPTAPNLTILDATVVANSTKSLSRGGTEVVAFSDATPNEVFYIGVKSEDQEAAEYAFFGVFSEAPFSQTDSNGVESVRGINVPAVIPDGNAAHPGVARVIAIALQPITVRRVVVTNTITHENLGDLFGQLKHGQQDAALNNHSFGGANLTQTFIYEDNGENDIAFSQPSDGPPHLTVFNAEHGEGLWLLTELDNAQGHTGRVERLSIRIDPQSIPGGGPTILDIQPNSFGFITVDVPPEATNMTICVANISTTPLPVQLFVRKDSFPTLTNFDYTLTIPISGACLSISTTDLPPLSAGRYIIGVYNPNGIAQKVAVTVTFGLSLAGVPTVNFTSDVTTPILDDAVSYSSIVVTNNQRIVRCEVGVSIDHPRISDMVLTLLSPSGKRILLYENRGGPNAANLGGGGTVTNFFGTQTAGGFLADTNVLSPVPTEGTLIIDYDFFPVPDTLDVFYDGANIFSIGPISGPGTITVPYGPGLATDMTIVMNLGNNSNITTAWIYTPRIVSSDVSYFLFSENTNNAKLPLKFAVDAQDQGNSFVLGNFESPILAGDYIAPTFIGGWLLDTNQIGAGTNQFGGIITNQVSIVNDPLTAKAPGTQFLALGTGILSTNLTVLPANHYILSYIYRGPGILGWWRGEPLAISAIDFADGHNGTLLNGTTFAVGGGMVNSAFSFDGINQCIQIPYSTNLITPQYSVDAWVEPLGPVTDTNNNQALIFGQGFGHLQLVVRPGTNGVFAALQFGTNSSTFFGVVSTVEIPTNAFTYLAGTWDGVTLRLYVNGNLNAQSVPGAVPADSGCSFFIGGFDDPSTNSCQVAPSQFFNGLVDELSLYGRALSATEIKAIYDLGSAGKFNRRAAGEPGVTSLSSTLAEAKVSLGGGRTDTLFGQNTNWQVRSMTFTPSTPLVSLQVTGIEPGMLMDNFVLTRIPNETFVLPESSLEELVGDSSQGTWTLEMWDNRAGAPIGGQQQLNSWQLRFILQTNSPPITPLFDRVPVTNTVPPCQFAYFYVDVPSWVSSITNRLLFADPPGVTVWFNQTAPTSTNFLATDYPIIPGSATLTTSGSFVLTSNSVPPLLSGSRYYLAVQTPCPSLTNITFAIEVDFGVQFIRLTNMIPYVSTNSGATNGTDYYIFTVSTNAARAQFEILNFPTSRMSLVARKGLPPPGLGIFDYISTNGGFNGELIVVITNSTPVPLTPGDWFLTAINLSGGPGAYAIMASEWPVTGRPFSITNIVLSTNGYCLTWEALNGVHYFVQGVPNLNGSNWYAASFTQTETATNGFLSFCVPNPSPFQFFRIAEDLSLIDVPQPPPTLLAVAVTNGVQMTWFDSVTARYQMQWTHSLNSPVVWTSFTNNAVSPFTGFFQFLDDGTQTGGFGGPTFYRASQIIVP